MKKLYYLLLPVVLFVGCNDGGSPLGAPSNVANISTKADTGAVIVSWDMPADSSFLYLNVSYDKYPDNPDTNKVITTKVSKYTDSVKIAGLLNKYQYTFDVQPFNANSKNTVSGKTLTSEPARPISRPVKKVYYPDELTEVELGAEMLTPISVDYADNGPANLLDDDINTFWHTSWYYSPTDPPHWLEIDFGEEVSLGAFNYSLRQTSDTRGFPTQFTLEVSDDGSNWEEVWRSEPDLPYSPVDSQFELNFGRNYKSQYFRLSIAENAGDGAQFSHMSELNVFKMKVEITDLEEQAEENY